MPTPSANSARQDFSDEMHLVCRHRRPLPLLPHEEIHVPGAPEAVLRLFTSSCTPAQHRMDNRVTNLELQIRTMFVATPTEGRFHITSENIDKLVRLAHAAEFDTPCLADITILPSDTAQTDEGLQPQAQAELAKDSYLFLTGQLNTRDRECYDQHVQRLRHIATTTRDRRPSRLRILQIYSKS